MRTYDLVDVDTRPKPAYDAEKQETMDWGSVQFPAIPCRPHTFTPIYLTDDFQPPQQESWVVLKILFSKHILDQYANYF